MLLNDTKYEIDTPVALGIVAGILGIALIASFVRARLLARKQVSAVDKPR